MTDLTWAERWLPSVIRDRGKDPLAFIVQRFRECPWWIFHLSESENDICVTANFKMRKVSSTKSYLKYSNHINCEIWIDPLSFCIWLFLVSDEWIVFRCDWCLAVYGFPVTEQITLSSHFSFNKSRGEREGRQAQKLDWLTFIHLYHTAHTPHTSAHTETEYRIHSVTKTRRKY